VLALSSLAALALGIAIYVMDRDWATALFLVPLAGWQGGQLGLFGKAGDVLPSFLHAYAFATLLVLTMPRRPRSRAWLCAGWFAVAAALECLQADAVADLVFGQGTTPLGHPLLRPLQLYALHGTFDIADLWASAMGCATAFLATSTLEHQR
jgi:hypothetical protein